MYIKQLEHEGDMYIRNLEHEGDTHMSCDVVVEGGSGGVLVNTAVTAECPIVKTSHFKILNCNSWCER